MEATFTFMFQLFLIIFVLQGLEMFQIETIYANPGEDVTMKCPNDNVSAWQFYESKEIIALCGNGQNTINPSSNISERIYVTSDCQLKIQNFTNHDLCRYLCFPYGEDEEIYEINIQPRSISIIEANKSSIIQCKEGDKITLTCIVHGSSIGETLQWTSENHLLTSNDTNFVTYTFIVHKSYNMKEFICSLNNSIKMNELTVSVKLKLVCRPPVPQNIQIVALNTELIIRWNAGHKCQHQIFVVEYLQRFQSRWSSMRTSNTSSIVISALEQDTVYFVRMFSRTSTDYSNKTDEIIFKTGRKIFHTTLKDNETDLLVLQKNAQRGKIQSNSCSVEFAVTGGGILFFILLGWCLKKAYKRLTCRQGNREISRFNNSRSDGTTLNRTGVQYDEIGSIAYDPASIDIRSVEPMIISQQLQTNQPDINVRNQDYTNSTFDVSICTDGGKHPCVMKFGITGIRNVSNRSSSEESYLVPCRKYINGGTDSDDQQNEDIKEVEARGEHSPFARLSQTSETHIKSISKYETLQHRNAVQHFYEPAVFESCQ